MKTQTHLERTKHHVRRLSAGTAGVFGVFDSDAREFTEATAIVIGSMLDMEAERDKLNNVEPKVGRKVRAATIVTG